MLSLGEGCDRWCRLRLERELEDMKIRAETAEKEVQALVKKQINVQIDSSSEMIQLRKEYEQL